MRNEDAFHLASYDRRRGLQRFIPACAARLRVIPIWHSVANLCILNQMGKVFG